MSIADFLRAAPPALQDLNAAWSHWLRLAEKDKPLLRAREPLALRDLQEENAWSQYLQWISAQEPLEPLPAVPAEIRARFRQLLLLPPLPPPGAAADAAGGKCVARAELLADPARFQPDPEAVRLAARVPGWQRPEFLAQLVAAVLLELVSAGKEREPELLLGWALRDLREAVLLVDIRLAGNRSDQRLLRLAAVRIVEPLLKKPGEADFRFIHPPWRIRVLELAVRNGLLWAVGLGGELADPSYLRKFVSPTWHLLYAAEVVQPGAALALGLPELFTMHCAGLREAERSPEALEAWILLADSLVMASRSVIVDDPACQFTRYHLVDQEALIYYGLVTFGSVMQQLRRRQPGPRTASLDRLLVITLHMIGTVLCFPEQWKRAEWQVPVYALVVGELVDKVQRDPPNGGTVSMSLHMVARLLKPSLLLDHGLLVSVTSKELRDLGEVGVGVHVELLNVVNYGFVELLATPRDHPEFQATFETMEMNLMRTSFLSELFRSFEAAPDSPTLFRMAASLHRFLGLLNMLCDRLPELWKPVCDRLRLNGQSLLKGLRRLEQLEQAKAYDVFEMTLTPVGHDAISPWDWVTVWRTPDIPWVKLKSTTPGPSGAVPVVASTCLAVQRGGVGSADGSAPLEKRRHATQAGRQQALDELVEGTLKSLKPQQRDGFPELLDRARDRRERVMPAGFDCNCCGGPLRLAEAPMAAGAEAPKKPKAKTKKKRRKKKRQPQPGQQQDEAAAAPTGPPDDVQASAAALQQLQLDQSSEDEAKAADEDVGGDDDAEETFAGMPSLIPDLD